MYSLRAVLNFSLVRDKMCSAYHNIETRAMNIKSMPQWAIMQGPSWPVDTQIGSQIVFWILWSLETLMQFSLAAFPLVAVMPIIYLAYIFPTQTATSPATQRALAAVAWLSSISWLCGVTAGFWIERRNGIQVLASLVGALSFFITMNVTGSDTDPNYKDPPSILQLRVLTALCAALHLSYFVFKLIELLPAFRS